MAYTFRRAYKSCLASSATCAIGFLANNFSAIMPVRALGNFAFINIMVMYCLIVLYFPPFFMLNEKIFGNTLSRRKKYWCCGEYQDKITREEEI